MFITEKIKMMSYSLMKTIWWCIQYYRWGRQFDGQSDWYIWQACWRISHNYYTHQSV